MHKLPPLNLCDECQPLGYCKERARKLNEKVKELKVLLEVKREEDQATTRPKT